MMVRMNLPKAYHPSDYESDIYALWEKSGAFKPTGKGQPYSLVIPPPNANGNLHLGHGLTLAVEDILVRYHRLKGGNVLFVPGADHAGFETQVVYERELAKEGKSRFDFSREELYGQIWDFVALNRENFEGQIRKLGASVDWEHHTFTLDDKIVKRAYATFKKMWDDKLIYRGERLVNYCTHHRTGFADIEVVYEEQATPLYYIKYGPFTLATTRPETKFGDTAVAVHPGDERYKDWVGKTVKVEGVNGPFEVMVVEDEMVDPNFGTGAVKITPAHSFDDWEVAQRHNLPAVRVINHDGTMNERAGRFRGMPVLEAREAVVKAMKEQGLLVKVDENYQNRIGKCYKCGTVIEPMLMEQWFIDMQPLTKEAVKALRDDEITFYPEAKKDQLVGYLEGLRDWNISRQIAWGIPIPAFQNVDDSDDWIYDERVDQEIIEVDGKTYHRDPDVFDTWFSSSSWPYATLNYPDGEEYKEFYPLSVMETASDILYPWVSRMLMFGLYVTGQVPFRHVYLHGLIQDEHGQKMSKSKGNVIDPMVKIQAFGSDAFRMGIISDETPGSYRPYDESKLVGARNFCNKLWNIARYIEGVLGDETSRAGAKPESPADHWLLSKLQQSTEEIQAHLDNYRFSEAYETLYHFVWDDAADWYIEASKAEPNKPLLAFILEAILMLAHPFAPFLTETVWQTLAWEKDSLLATRTFLKVPSADKKKAEDFQETQNIITEIRAIMNALKVSGVTLYYTDVPFLAENAALIKRMARLKNATEVESGNGMFLTSTKYRCWLDIDPSTAKAYVKELDAKRQAQEEVIKRLEGRLGNKSYVDNAPHEVVSQTKEQLALAREQLDKIWTEYKRFS
jgi:valyl-tRNA synthetase